MKTVNKTNKKQFLALTALTVLGCAFVQPCNSMNTRTKKRMDVLIKQMQPQALCNHEVKSEKEHQDSFIIINGIKLKYDRSEYNGKVVYVFPTFESYWDAISKICKNIDKNNEIYEAIFDKAKKDFAHAFANNVTSETLGFSNNHLWMSNYINLMKIYTDQITKENFTTVNADLLLDLIDNTAYSQGLTIENTSAASLVRKVVSFINESTIPNVSSNLINGLIKRKRLFASSLVEYITPNNIVQIPINTFDCFLEETADIVEKLTKNITDENFTKIPSVVLYCLILDDKALADKIISYTTADNITDLSPATTNACLQQKPKEAVKQFATCITQENFHNVSWGLLEDLIKNNKVYLKPFWAMHQIIKTHQNKQYICLKNTAKKDSKVLKCLSER